MSRQLSCRDMCKIMIWSNYLRVRAIYIFTRFEWWAYKPLVKRSPGNTITSRSWSSSPTGNARYPWAWADWVGGHMVTLVVGGREISLTVGGCGGSCMWNIYVLLKIDIYGRHRHIIFVVIIYQWYYKGKEGQQWRGWIKVFYADEGICGSFL